MKDVSQCRRVGALFDGVVHTPASQGAAYLPPRKRNAPSPAPAVLAREESPTGEEMKATMSLNLTVLCVFVTCRSGTSVFA